MIRIFTVFNALAAPLFALSVVQDLKASNDENSSDKAA